MTGGECIYPCDRAVWSESGERWLCDEPGHRPDDRRGWHVCADNPVPYVSDGALGHGFECGICGAFLQAG